MKEEDSLLKDIKVIDLTTVLAGPSVGTFLAELGADVLKIENPHFPDVTRSWKLPHEDKESPISSYFSSINYRKSYLPLDLYTDKEKLLELVKSADIVLMNYKLGDQEKFGITDSLLRKENPQLIIGKISGYGKDSDRVAYDLILQAESGFMSINGTPESGPLKMPVALIDVLTAHQLKEGILLQLFLKAKNGTQYQGKTVYVSLYQTAVSSLINQASNYLMTGNIPKRIGSLHPNIAPYGETFLTRDQKVITFAIGSNKHFQLLCEFLEMQEISHSDKFKENQNRVIYRTELAQLIREKIRELNAQDILTSMQKNHVPCGELKNLEEVFKNPLAQDLIRSENIDGKDTKRVSSITFRFE